jgi:eukaryotic-like serine/threonine-protein kinase
MSNPERSRELDAILAAYLEAEGAGAAHDRASLLARHPEFAADLRRYFAAEDSVELIAAPLRPVGDPSDQTPALGPDAGGTPASLGRDEGPAVSVPGYEVGRELGRGGMGVVYEARHLTLGRTVALKMILAGGHADERQRQRFRAEAQAAARLSHPNVVQVYEVGEHAGLPYLALELCPGGSLDDRLGGTPLPPRVAATLLLPVARAVHAAHAAGVVHRDLKPANVLLTADGTPKVADFGLAKDLSADGQTASGAVVGTPSYVAPEQAAAERSKVGPLSDTYALGAILYECLTGRPPFTGPTALDTLLQVMHDEPVPPRQLQPKTPRDLETVCLKCLHKEPQRRYASAAELADDLERWLRGELVRARPVGRLAQGWRWCRRNPAVAGLVLAIGLALLLGAGVATAFAFVADENARKEAGARKDADENARQATESAREVARRLYISDMRLVQQAWEQRAYDRANELLDGQRPENTGGTDLRHFEWYYWRRCLDFPLHTFTVCDINAGGIAYDLAVSQDGGLLAVRCQPAGIKSLINVFETAGWREVASFSGQAGSETSMAFSPDGKRLLCGQLDGTIDVWDVAQQTRAFSFRAGGQNKDNSPCAFSRDGKLVAYSGQGSEVSIFEVETGKPVTRFTQHHSFITGVDFHPDGKRVASSDASSEKEVKVWDMDTGEVVQTLKGADGLFACVRYSPDGKQIAAIAYPDPNLSGVSVWLWEADTGQKVRTFSLGKSEAITVIAFSHDGRLLVGGCAWTTRVWDVRTGEVVRTLQRHTHGVRNVAFSPDDKRVYTVGDEGTAKVWDLTKGQESLSLTDRSYPVACLALSPDGERVVCIGDGPWAKTELFDTRTGDLVPSFKPPPTGGNRLAFSPDGKQIAREGPGLGVITLLDTETGQELRSFNGQVNVWSIAWSPDGRTIAVGSPTGGIFGQQNDQAVILWDAVSGQRLRTWRSELQGPHDVAFSPDGKRLAHLDVKAVTIWGVTTGEEVWTAQDANAGLGAVAFTPDGKWLVSAHGKNLKIWDASDGRVVKTLKAIHLFAESLAISQDGRRIITGSSSQHDSPIRVWDVDSGQEVLTLSGQPGGITGVAISPDGMRIISSSTDKTLRLWNATPRAPAP